MSHLVEKGVTVSPFTHGTLRGASVCGGFGAGVSPFVVDRDKWLIEPSRGKGMLSRSRKNEPTSGLSNSSWETSPPSRLRVVSWK